MLSKVCICSVYIERLADDDGLGHKDAWEKARILHRDVSFNNILILETVSPDGSLKRKGVLSDWELSKYRENMETGKGPTQPDHTVGYVTSCCEAR